MGLVSSVAMIRIDANTSNNYRQWRAAATQEQTPAGELVTINFTQAHSTLSPPGTADVTRDLEVRASDGTLIRTFTWTEGDLSETFQFYNTVDGLSGSSPRSGTLHLVLHVERSGVNGYNIESDGSPNTPPTGYSITTSNHAYIISTTTATVALSNVALGGVKTEPAQFGESVFGRVVLGAAPWQSRSVTLALTGTSKTKASTASASATQDVTFSGTGIADGRVNEGFPAADGTYTSSVTIPNDATTGLPWTVLTSTTQDTLRVDPRVTAVHLLQLDDSTYGTPPLSKATTDNERPSTSIGNLTTAIHGARGGVAGNVLSEGVNGLTASVTLTAQSTGDVVSRTGDTGTQGGEDGWADGFMQWTSALPSGTWTKQVTLTAPADIDDASYLLNASTDYMLIAGRNPYVTVVVNVSNGQEGRHLQGGDALEVVAYLKRTKEGDRRLLEFAASPVPAVSLERVNAGVVETFDGTSWVAANPDLVYLPLTQDSTYVWSRSFTTAEGWGDVRVNVAGYFESVLYDGSAYREMVDSESQHNVGPSLDALDLGLNGTLSLR